MTKDEAKQKVQELVKKYEKVKLSRSISKYTEEETKKGFIEPLFEALGWNLRDKDEVSAEESLSSGRPDYGFYLEGRLKFYLEAKPLKSDLHRVELADQAVRYSWNKGATWAILTDFESLKVFNAQVIDRSLSDKLFYEIPYSQYLERFDQLWFLSKEAFKESLLDKDAETHGKKLQRISVTDKLYKDLNECREILTHDLALWNKDLDKDLLDEGVQKLLDRLIFLRVAEDRGIEPRTLIPLIRDWKNNGAKKHLYESMIKKFREFDAIYNSNLFSEHPFEKWEEYSGATEKAIKILYGKPGYYEYDFKAMPADVLGGVYENYLGYRLEKSRKGLSVSKDAKKRKESGIYYTPDFIVDYIVKSTLKPVLDKCKSIKDLKKIKVLDPACGSGSFLIKALEVIHDKYVKFGNRGETWTKLDILLNNIYGVDLDQQAIEIARLNLLINTLDQRIKLPSLANNIKKGNSLISDKKVSSDAFNWKEEFPEVFKQGGFDVVIGNPPYVTSRSEGFSKLEKTYFLNNYFTLKDKPNTYLLFIERAISLLKQTGYLGFIVPNSWLGIESAQKLRELILEKTSLFNLINTYGFSFSSAQVETMVLILQNKPPHNDLNVTVANINAENFLISDSKVVKQSMWTSTDPIDLVSVDIDHAILNKILLSSFKLSDLMDCKSGLQAYEVGKGRPPQTKADVTNRIYDAKTYINKSTYKYLEGRDVSRYRLEWGGTWLQYGDFLSQPRTLEIFRSPRILIREVTGKSPYRIQATFEDRTFLNNKSILNVVSRDKNIKLLLAILAVLNSKIMSFYYSRKAAKSNRTLFPKLVLKDVRDIPIPRAIKNNLTLSRDVKKILEDWHKLSKANENSEKWNSIKNEIERTDKKIEEKVYKLYGLKEKEIEIIEKV